MDVQYSYPEESISGIMRTSRNPKTVVADLGPILLQVQRDCHGTFKPQLVENCQYQK